MTDLPCCFKVVVARRKVHLEAVPSSACDEPELIRRLVDAMAVLRERREAETLDGEAYFAELNLAKDYARLNIEEIEARLSNEFEAIQNFKLD